MLRQAAVDDNDLAVREGVPVAEIERHKVRLLSETVAERCVGDGRMAHDRHPDWQRPLRVNHVQLAPLDDGGTTQTREWRLDATR